MIAMGTASPEGYYFLGRAWSVNSLRSHLGCTETSEPSWVSWA